MTSMNSLLSSSSLWQVSTSMTLRQQGRCCDNEGDGNAGGRVNRAGRGGQLFSALMQSLSQLGLQTPQSSGSASDSGNSDANATPSNSNTPQTLHTFMHDLFGALSAQGGNSAGPSQAASSNSADSDGDDDGSGAQATQSVSGKPHHRGAWAAQFQDKLQSLIQKLSTTDQSSNGPNAAISTLQTDYQNLLSSLGGSNGNVSLSDFLQALRSNLHGSNPGLNVNTSA